MLTLSTEHETRLVLAKTFERRHDPKEKVNLVLPAYLKKIQETKTSASKNDVHFSNKMCRMED